MTLSPFLKKMLHRKEKGKTRDNWGLRYAALGKARIEFWELPSSLNEPEIMNPDRRTVHTGVRDATLCSRKQQLGEREWWILNLLAY